MTNFPALKTPGPLADGAMRITPLGGLGEVGRNMTVFELGGKLLIVDCGVLFPEEDQPGVDLILPDFSSIEHRIDDVVALVLTHGHEDHIGGVPYLLRLREDIPLVGSELTLAFVEAKLKEHRIRPVLRQVIEHEEVSYGPFDLEFVAVNHSIPDAMAVMIRTDAGNVLATGDFKMDSLPIDGRITDLRSFARFGEEGVDLFCVDSTNAEVPGMVGHEGEIGQVLDNVFADSDGQIVVASFASHVHRVQQVLDAAALHDRRVALVGRSMVRNMGIAAERGYLKVPAGVLIDARDITSLPPHERVLMVTGSQGEPMAALSRMAHSEHRSVTIEPGDTVIFASSLIWWLMVGSPSRRESPRNGSCCVRTAWPSTWRVEWPVSPARCPAATSTSTAPRWGRSTRPSSRTAASWRRRASSRSTPWWRLRLARSWPAPTSRRGAWRRTTRSSRRSFPM